MAAKKSFSISDAVSYGWKISTSKLGFFIPLLLIIFIVPMIPDLVNIFLGKNNAIALAFLMQIVKWILQLVISVGTIFVALKIHDKKKATFSDLFSKVNLIVPYFLASLVMFIIIIPGALLLAGGVITMIIHTIIPDTYRSSGIILIILGFIWMAYIGVKLHYYPYLIVDKALGPIKSLKASWNLTKGFFWKLFFLGIVLALINIVGFICLFVGLFITIPLSMMAEVYVFRKLQGK